MTLSTDIHAHRNPWSSRAGRRAWEAAFSHPDTFEGVVSDPQSLHKYLYVHGDPVNGIDPTGQFFASVQLTVTGIQSRNFSAHAAAAFVVLDRAQTAADAFTAFSSLVATGTIPLPLLAGLLISVVPGSGLARIVGVGGRFLSPFIRAGRLAFDAGGSVASFLTHGGTGRLVDALDVMSDTFRGLKGAASAANGPNTLVHFAGDMGAVKVADKLGLQAADDFLIRHTGIDGLYRHGDSIVIVEAKGFTTGTSVSLGATQHGQQLSQEWIRQKAVELRNLAVKQPEYAHSASILEDALESGNIKVLLTKTEVSHTADEILDVSYELRNWGNLKP